MSPPYRKKLIEVSLPLKAINEASAREKSIRHGDPSTLHLWWARPPLAACRAVPFASLATITSVAGSNRRESVGNALAGASRSQSGAAR
jgi:adenine-specific DNA methylase